MSNMSKPADNAAPGAEAAHANAEQTAENGAAAKPFLRIAKGNPDDTQIAALTTVFAGMIQAAEQDIAKEKRDRNLWGNLEERLRKPMLYNPNAFRNVSYY